MTTTLPTPTTRLFSAPANMGWFSRLRHGRGFGIHSPFAYRFITETLRERLPYYSYKYLDDSRLRLLLRVLCRLQPKSVCIVAPDHQYSALQATVRAYCSTAKVWRDINHRAEFVVIYANKTTNERALIELCRAATAVMILGPCKHSNRLWNELLQAPHGMSFDNFRNTRVFVAYAHLPRQDFDVKF